MMHKELDNVIVESNISIDYFDEMIKAIILLHHHLY